MQAFHFVIASVRSGNVEVHMPVLLDLLSPILYMQVLLISSLQLFISIGFCLSCWEIHNWAHGLQLSRRDIFNSFTKISQSLFGRFNTSNTHVGLKYRRNDFLYSILVFSGTSRYGHSVSTLLFCQLTVRCVPCRIHGIRMSKLWQRNVCNTWCGNFSLPIIWKE